MQIHDIKFSNTRLLNVSVPEDIQCILEEEETERQAWREQIQKKQSLQKLGQKEAQTPRKSFTSHNFPTPPCPLSRHSFPSTHLYAEMQYIWRSLWRRPYEANDLIRKAKEFVSDGAWARRAQLLNLVEVLHQTGFVRKRRDEENKIWYWIEHDEEGKLVPWKVPEGTRTRKSKAQRGGDDVKKKHQKSKSRSKRGINLVQGGKDMANDPVLEKEAKLQAPPDIPEGFEADDAANSGGTAEVEKEVVRAPGEADEVTSEKTEKAKEAKPKKGPSRLGRVKELLEKYPGESLIQLRDRLMEGEPDLDKGYAYRIVYGAAKNCEDVESRVRVGGSSKDSKAAFVRELAAEHPDMDQKMLAVEVVKKFPEMAEDKARRTVYAALKVKTTAPPLEDEDRVVLESPPEGESTAEGSDSE